MVAPTTQPPNVEMGATAETPTMQKALGLLAVLISCCTSGFAGVYFELLIKYGSKNRFFARLQGVFNVIGRCIYAVGSIFRGTGRSSRPKTRAAKQDLVSRNIQLAAIGVAASLVGCVFKDARTIVNKGFFHGYSLSAVAVVLIQAGGECQGARAPIQFSSESLTLSLSVHIVKGGSWSELWSSTPTTS